MIRGKNYFVIAACAILFSQVGLNSPAAQEAIPETPAGKCLTALLEIVVNGTDADARQAFLKDGFAKHDEETLKRRELQVEQVNSQLGQMTFKEVVGSTDFQISAACECSNGPAVVLTITVTESSPYKIESVELEMIEGDVDAAANDAPLEADEKTEIIARLAEELRAKYVYPKVGEEMAVAVETSAADGDYKDVESVRSFATKLTEQLQAICNDKHLRVRAGAPRDPGNSPGRRPVDNHGFVKAEVLPGGIGYLKFNFFSGDEQAKPTAAAAMNFLANSNALIFDLRENGGGSPEMIAYLSSYLFDEPVHLNSFYNRPTETTTETWTQKDVPGEKFRADTPVYVLTSAYTFSGAEEFTYNLKNLKRGTIVGETTGGGAHPVMPVTLGKRMNITMPFARAINPITETNWEGVGVKPDVEVAADQALEKAIELARSEATELASKTSTEMEKTETADVDEDELSQKADELMANQSFGEAAKAYAQLTNLDPENGIYWFRYGYCLHGNGDLEQAIEIHKKAAQFDRFAPVATYNIACVYSLQEKIDLAFEALNKAVELGFRDAGQLEGDSDLDNLREDKRYADILKKLKGGQ